MSEIALLVFGFVLVVGIVGEYWGKWNKWLKIFKILVIIGVGGELVADGGIYFFSIRLQTISDSEIAVLRLKAAELEKDLISVGSRTRLLYGKRRELLVEELRSYAGQKAEVRFCQQYLTDNDTMGVALLLLNTILPEAHWSVRTLAPENCGGTGVSVSVSSRASPATRNAADAVVSAFSEVQVGVVGQKVFYLLPGEQEPSDVNTVVIVVLAHPL